MLNNLFSKVDRVLSLGNSGPLWWRILGGAISFAVLVAVCLALRR
jgi:hypothetical protein